MAVVQIIKNGDTRDSRMQEMLRELVMLAAVEQFEIIPVWISSQDNRVPDILSRLHLDPKYQQELKELKGDNWKQINVVKQEINELCFY